MSESDLMAEQQAIIGFLDTQECSDNLRQRVTEMADRIRHDGEMMRRIASQRDAARQERDSAKRELLDALIELRELRRRYAH